MAEQTPFDRMRRAADWLEANGIDWATYTMEDGSIGLGWVDFGDQRQLKFEALFLGLEASITHEENWLVYNCERDGFLFQWRVWKQPKARQESVVEKRVIGQEVAW